jgi:hypothetical protein
MDDFYVEVNYEKMGKDPEYRVMVNHRNKLMRMLGKEHQRVRELEAEIQALREQLDLWSK